MVIPNDVDGYTLFSIDDSEISTYTSKLLFQHHSKKFYHLFDRLTMVNEELKYISDYISGISESWSIKFKGRIINRVLRMIIIYADKPKHYGYYGNYIFAASYSYIKHYIQQIIKLLILDYGLPNKYYKLQIKKKDLFYISELFANAMLPLCEELLPKYRKLNSSTI